MSQRQLRLTSNLEAVARPASVLGHELDTEAGSPFGGTGLLSGGIVMLGTTQADLNASEVSLTEAMNGQIGKAGATFLLCQIRTFQLSCYSSVLHKGQYGIATHRMSFVVAAGLPSGLMMLDSRQPDVINCPLKLWHASPGAVRPASRLGRRYAGAPY